MEKYLKYYWLEKYIEDDVCSDFHNKKGVLASFQFFSIIEWKNPKVGKTHIAKELREDENVKQLMEKIYHEKDLSKKLSILLSVNGIKLATASAILTNLYPEEFTIYDIRVRKQLKKLGEWRENPDDITYDIDVVRKYFEKYLSPLKKIARENNLSLRDCDRALWAKDWSEDLRRFIKPSVYKSG